MSNAEEFSRVRAWLKRIFQGDYLPLEDRLKQFGKRTHAFVREISLVILLVTIVSAANVVCHLRSHRVGYDFGLRYNECCCVSEGLDPFLVWKKEVVSDKWAPWDWGYGDFYEGRLRVNGYPPWEYFLMMPFTWVDKESASYLYACIEVFCFCFLLFQAYRFGKNRTMSSTIGMLCALSSAMIFYCFCNNSIYKNFGICMAAAMVGMALALNENREYLAGLLWAFLLCKPQLGAIFIIPLLFFRKFRTIATAAAICCLSTFVVSLKCGTPFFDLLFEILNYGPKDCLFTALAPAWMVRLLDPVIGKSVLFMVCAMVGAFLCYLTTQKVDATDWRTIFLPAMLCSLWWSKAWYRDLCVQAFPLAVLLMMSLKEKSFIRACGFVLMMVLLVTTRRSAEVNGPSCLVAYLPPLLFWALVHFQSHKKDKPGPESMGGPELDESNQCEGSM